MSVQEMVAEGDKVAVLWTFQEWLVFVGLLVVAIVITIERLVWRMVRKMFALA